MLSPSVLNTSRGAAQLTDLLVGPLDHAVALAGMGDITLPVAGDFEALFGARLGLQLGHLALLWPQNKCSAPKGAVTAEMLVRALIMLDLIPYGENQHGVATAALDQPGDEGSAYGRGRG
jgi:hypothetical protein